MGDIVVFQLSGVRTLGRLQHLHTHDRAIVRYFDPGRDDYNNIKISSLGLQYADEGECESYRLHAKQVAARQQAQKAGHQKNRGTSFLRAR